MKRYLRCRWAIDEGTVRRLERLNRASGLSVQRLVNDVLMDYLVDRRSDSRRRSVRTPRVV